MELRKLEHEFSVCKLKDTAQINFAEDFVFLSKTDDEISLVCKTACIPANVISVENGWKGLKISGQLDFGLVGIIAKIAGILARAGISVFVVSTYNTDYIFVKAERLESCVEALTANGYAVM